ncbi:hypothetical protein EMIHUDRAFT_465463 [Emiliania huxleyi CCMP1516]|uniref:Fe2OG dioxygenase domain-containing protein n=2 Tax=Emiliania huxleyi TaxID=2903 RepID=A0A0D3ICR3_EMIH1|nr:hypothetical protein EMIHUDRAFT_465463 [Emiliania huxleyi CCMP1516]EOD09048.1 hypothetical protein EMIHUDRAFT_465463 [Emiliania huxleyi CCMP1516]|eukprot:XP_005761477.1 hypothetical protein EMIHUDRAFT_465463 [Emiliania huxleyi CCMP1516]
MGKKPEKLKKPGHRKAERRGGIGVGALVGALLAAAAAGYYVYSSRATLVPAVRRGSVGGGGQNAASSRSAAVAGETDAQRKRRLLNEGRMDPSMQRPKCKDASFGCSGECYRNTEYMLRTCCLSCSPDYDDPCTHNPTERRAVAEYPQYSPRVLSRDPWVVTFDNLLSDEETDGIVEAVGGKSGEYLKPSTTAKATRGKDGRVVLQDVPDQIRTSYNAWCQHPGCYNHPVHERVIERIMDIVGLPQNNAEHMQLLKYHPGEYYRLHHDWIPEQLQALCGPRVFTFFLYLSDVDEGGGTQFPYLNLTVMPKRGSAVWWPHGLEDNPWKKDDRTHHEAMPVLQGVKMAANYWIHVDDFKQAMALGCDGRQGQPRRIWRK